MNITFKYVHVPILLILFSIQSLCSQQSNIINFGEKVALITDRNLYIAGERIKFSAFLSTADSIQKQGSSLVLYCELITPGGEKICGNKYIIIDNFSSGNLLIPGDISTGIYYLRAYTRFMRNKGPSSYNYTIIKIVNADRSEILQSEINTSVPESIYETCNSKEDSPDRFKVVLDKTGYKRRESVNLIVDGNKSDYLPFIGLSLAVIPEYTLSGTRVTLPETVQNGTYMFYAVETQGPSVTGKLTDSSSGTPVRDSRINLSIMGKQKDFMAQQTDSAGRFFFSMPEYFGYRDLFLCTDDSNHSKLRILVDNDFCTTPLNIPSSAFNLTPGEHDIALNMAVNLQVGSYFGVDSVTKGGLEMIEETTFYGKPSDIIYIDKYVQLPTLEEYFNSLPSLVKVRKHSGEKYFKIIGTQSALSDFDPLVLVDMVAIGDPSKVLAIPPVTISRIEVVNSLYIKGDQKYGGIINIITKKSDFGGIDLPSSGIFINYCFLSEKSTPAVVMKQLSNIPDTRNTLYWEPRLVLNNQNVSEISFPTSDTPGKYLIVLSWIDTKGEINRQISEFEVQR
jgi:hypothetical protein